MDPLAPLLGSFTRLALDGLPGDRAAYVPDAKQEPGFVPCEFPRAPRS